jgi:UDP:flavonoid glycosyltransferase YjiC (YdhE family)
MRCIVTSYGSAGDFVPTLAVGAELRRRGHAVRFVGNPFYEARVRRAGLAFVPAGAPVDVYDMLERTPAYADPANAGKLLRDLMGPNVEGVYRVLADALRAERPDVVVTNDVSFSALWAAAEQRVPSVMIHASPMMWMSRGAPIMLTEHALPACLARPLTVAFRGLLDWYVTRYLRPVARTLGVALPDVSLRATERVAARRFGLWSPALRGPVAGDPPNGTICGFARGSGFGGALSPEVAAFLDAGPPPVVVGLGSVFSLVFGALQTALAEACADLGRRCLVVGHPADATFPSNTLAVRYAPYDLVFPRAAAVVVHGGAGTTGEALRAGRPVVGVPFAYDQFDLCARIEALGVGVRVRLGQRTREHFRAVLQRVLADEPMRRRAAETGPRFAAERDGAEVAADGVEALVARAPSVAKAVGIAG